jgi:hypothetical protein
MDDNNKDYIEKKLVKNLVMQTNPVRHSTVQNEAFGRR